MALYEIKEEKERVILVGVSTRENDDTEDSLDELKDLVCLLYTSDAADEL